MHFVDNTNEPVEIKQILENAELKYLDAWKVAIKNKTQQPNDNKWTNPKIRIYLANIFFKNCGYCGINIGYKVKKIYIKKIKRFKKYTKFTFLGQVDHFVPKSQNAELIYKFSNYIWACPNCNHSKDDFGFDANVDENNILNPCCFDDMKFLAYKNGGYIIKCQDKILKQKLDSKLRITHKYTSINFEDFVEMREDLSYDIELRVKEIERQKLLFDIGEQNDYEKCIAKLKSKIKNSPFKLLIRDVFYERFIKELESIEPQINKKNLGLEL